MLILSQRRPAITDEGRADKPISIWNVPRLLARYFFADSSDTKVFWTGSSAPM